MSNVVIGPGVTDQLPMRLTNDSGAPLANQIVEMQSSDQGFVPNDEWSTAPDGIVIVNIKCLRSVPDQIQYVTLRFSSASDPRASKSVVLAIHSINLTVVYAPTKIANFMDDEVVLQATDALTGQPLAGIGVDGFITDPAEGPGLPSPDDLQFDLNGPGPALKGTATTDADGLVSFPIANVNDGKSKPYNFLFVVSRSYNQGEDREDTANCTIQALAD